MITTQILSLINMAINEDLPGQDITTRSLFGTDYSIEAEIVAKDVGILAGIDVACEVFKQIDPNLIVEKLVLTTLAPIPVGTVRVISNKLGRAPCSASAS